MDWCLPVGVSGGSGSGYNLDTRSGIGTYGTYNQCNTVYAVANTAIQVRECITVLTGTDPLL